MTVVGSYEMVGAAMRACPDAPATQVRAAVDAVLALVNRDYNASPALCDQQCPSEPGAYCELPRGHANRSGRGHSATVTKAVDW